MNGKKVLFSRNLVSDKIATDRCRIIKKFSPIKSDKEFMQICINMYNNIIRSGSLIRVELLDDIIARFIFKMYDNKEFACYYMISLNNLSISRIKTSYNPISNSYVETLPITKTLTLKDIEDEMIIHRIGTHRYLTENIKSDLENKFGNKKEYFTTRPLDINGNSMTLYLIDSNMFSYDLLETEEYNIVKESYENYTEELKHFGKYCNRSNMDSATRC